MKEPTLLYKGKRYTYKDILELIHDDQPRQFDLEFVKMAKRLLSIKMQQEIESLKNIINQKYKD